MGAVWAWIRRLAARLFGRMTGTPQPLLHCLPSTPPGFTKCKFKVSNCLTCGQASKC